MGSNFGGAHLVRRSVLDKRSAFNANLAALCPKPWRMVALHGGAWLTFFLPPRSSATLTIFDWTCLVIIAGCVKQSCSLETHHRRAAR